MTPSQIAIVILLCTSALGWGCAFKYKGDAKAATAGTTLAQQNETTARQGAADAAKGTEAVLGVAEHCTGEMQRVRDENDQAEKDAYNAGLEEGKRAEKFYAELEKPAADDCAAIQEVKVCDRYMDY